jgi:hypothetical protein
MKDSMWKVVARVSTSRNSQVQKLGSVVAAPQEEFDASQAQHVSVGLPSWYTPEIETGDNKESQRDSYQFQKQKSPSVSQKYNFEESPETEMQKKEEEKGCVVSPVGRPRMSWDSLGLLALSMESWAVPFEIAFLGVQTPPFFYVLSIITTTFFSLDIILNCFTGFVSKGKIITNHKKVLINYFTGWFWIDAVATVPINLIFGAGTEADALSLVRISRGMKAMKMLRFLRMLKLLRLVRARAQAQRLQDNLLSSPKAQLALKPVFALLGLLVLSHFHACLFAAVTDLNVHIADGWIGDYDNEDYDPFKLYGFSFWWAYTKITFGNEVALKSIDEQIFALVITTEKLILLSLLIHWVVNTALLFSQDKAERFTRKSTVVEYFKRHKLPYHLTLQVISTLEQTHRAHHTLQHLEQLVWKDLPQSLRRIVAEELWSKHLMSLGLTLHVARWHRTSCLNCQCLCLNRFWHHRQFSFVKVNLLLLRASS